MLAVVSNHGAREKEEEQAEGLVEIQLVLIEAGKSKIAVWRDSYAFYLWLCVCV